MARLEGSAHSTGIFWSHCGVSEKFAGCADEKRIVEATPLGMERKDQKPNAGEDWELLT